MGELLEYNEEDNTVTFSHVGGTQTLSARGLQFEPLPPPRKIGWHEDREHPMSEGYAPVYVDYDGRAFVPGFPKFDDYGNLLHMVAVEVNSTMLTPLEKSQAVLGIPTQEEGETHA